VKILVVADASEVVESVRLGFMLQRREVEVLGAADGQTALDLVEREHPDLVLLDIGLADLDGFKVLEEIRACSDVLVVMLTARDDTMDKVKRLELGADDSITRPFNHLEASDCETELDRWGEGGGLASDAINRGLTAGGLSPPRLGGPCC
jgi:DNA-binding response OmpR family regulator